MSLLSLLVQSYLQNDQNEGRALRMSQTKDERVKRGERVASIVKKEGQNDILADHLNPPPPDQGSPPVRLSIRQIWRCISWRGGDDGSSFAIPDRPTAQHSLGPGTNAVGIGCNGWILLERWMGSNCPKLTGDVFCSKLRPWYASRRGKGNPARERAGPHRPNYRMSISDIFGIAVQNPDAAFEFAMRGVRELGFCVAVSFLLNTSSTSSSSKKH